MHAFLFGLLALVASSKLSVMESTVLRTTSTVGQIYTAIEYAAVLAARQAEYMTRLADLPVVHLTGLSYLNGQFPTIVDSTPNRTTEFWLSCDAMETDPTPLLTEPFERYGSPRCWCRSEWEAFCNQTEGVRAGNPCVSCERACEMIWLLQVSTALDPYFQSVIPDHPFTKGWAWTRAGSQLHTDCTHIWAVMPYSVQTGVYSFSGISGNPVAWPPTAKGGFGFPSDIVQQVGSKSMFDRTPVWSAPYWLEARQTVVITVGVAIWSKRGEHAGGIFADIPMSASKDFFLNLSVVSPVPFRVVLAYGNGGVVAASDEAIAQLWGTCAGGLCNISTLSPAMDSIAAEASGTASTYWEVTVKGEDYVVMHQTLELGWQLWFFIRSSDAFHKDTRTVRNIAVSVVVPVVALSTAFVAVVVAVHRRMRVRVNELEKQLGTLATSNVIGTPAEDAIQSLVRVQMSGRLPQELRKEVSTVMALIATNKLFKADSNLREKLHEMRLEGEVDAFILSVLTEKERPDDMASDSSTAQLLSARSSGQALLADVGSVPGSIDDPRADDVENALALLAKAQSRSGTPVAFDSWDFDVGSIGDVNDGKLLETVAMAALESHNLIEAFGLDKRKLSRFLRSVEKGYKDNPYHNSAHAADVVQAMHALLTGCTGFCFTPLEKLAALIAAACHDYGHWGVNNTFLQATMDALYVQYNGVSVLESMHSAESMRLMLGLGSGRSSTKEDREREGGGGQERGSFVRGKLTREDTYELHRSVAQLILATDMARHLELTSLFATRTTAGKMDPASKADRLLVLQMLIKASDVSNPARPWPACHRWARRVMDEFFAQGDAERALGLRVSPFMDRATADTPKCQLAFIKFVVRPMMELILPLCPAVAQRMLANLGDNALAWEREKACAP
eukprot:m51a1_g9217 putative 3 -cyclic-nucleotide phosphodiesterase rega (905) ;mRNA; f:54092-57345